MNRLRNALLVSILTVFGCSDPKTVTIGEGVTMTADGGQTHIESAEGGKTAFGTGLALPPEFPPDVPVYPGATVSMSMTNPGLVQVGWEAPDPLEKVENFYRGELESKGWKLTNTTKYEGTSLMAFEKPDRQCHLSVITGDPTQITVMLTESP